MVAGVLAHQVDHAGVASLRKALLPRWRRYCWPRSHSRLWARGQKSWMTVRLAWACARMARARNGAAGSAGGAAPAAGAMLRGGATGELQEVRGACATGSATGAFVARARRPVKE